MNSVIYINISPLRLEPFLNLQTKERKSILNQGSNVVVYRPPISKALGEEGIYTKPFLVYYCRNFGAHLVLNILNKLFKVYTQTE